MGWDGETSAWSPTWNRAAFLTESDEETDEMRLLVVDAEGGAAAREVARADCLSDLAWLDEHRLGSRRSGETDEVVVVDVDDGSDRVLTAGDVGYVTWSPARNAVAYVTGAPGDSHHVVVRSLAGASTVDVAADLVSSLVWSSTGRRLAVSASAHNGTGQIVVVDVVGEPRVHVAAKGTWYASPAAWSPDDRTLALIVGEDVAVLAVDGGGLRRVMTRGNNRVLGWTTAALPGTAPRPRPVPPAETAGGHQLRSRGAVAEISADGRWVAALLGPTHSVCDHVVGWRPATRSLVRLYRPAPCYEEPAYDLTYGLRLRGSRVTWSYFYCGNNCYLDPQAADLRRPGRCECGAGDDDTTEKKPRRPKPPWDTRRGVSLSFRHGVISLRRHADGAVRRFHPHGGAVDAELENTGLFYAYNTHGQGRVVCVPFGRLFRR